LKKSVGKKSAQKNGTVNPNQTGYRDGLDVSSVKLIKDQKEKSRLVYTDFRVMMRVNK
jgi:hypothetical protein